MNFFVSFARRFVFVQACQAFRWPAPGVAMMAFVFKDAKVFACTAFSMPCYNSAKVALIFDALKSSPRHDGF